MIKPEMADRTPRPFEGGIRILDKELFATKDAISRLK
jgi:hypothetical protein